MTIKPWKTKKNKTNGKIECELVNIIKMSTWVLKNTGVVLVGCLRAGNTEVAIVGHQINIAKVDHKLLNTNQWFRDNSNKSQWIPYNEIE